MMMMIKQLEITLILLKRGTCTPPPCRKDTTGTLPQQSKAETKQIGISKYKKIFHLTTRVGDTSVHNLSPTSGLLHLHLGHKLLGFSPVGGGGPGLGARKGC